MNQKSHEELSDSNNTLIGHLVELRVRLVNCLWAVLVGFVVSYNFTDKIMDVIRQPIAGYLQGGGLIFTAPMDKFMAHLKLAVFGGLVLVFPFVVYQLWKFIAPGLYEKEKKYAAGFVLSGTLMFFVGVLFTYFVVFPMAFKFLMSFGGETDKPMISITEYLSFFIITSLAFGAAFELPVVIVILGMMGVVSQQFLREKRRYAIMLMAILCAVITPPDLLSMVLMLAPMWLLYEIAVILVGFFQKKQNLAEE